WRRQSSSPLVPASRFSPREPAQAEAPTVALQHRPNRPATRLSEQAIDIAFGHGASALRAVNRPERFGEFFTREGGLVDDGSGRGRAAGTQAAEPAAAVAASICTTVRADRHHPDEFTFDAVELIRWPLALQPGRG